MQKFFRHSLSTKMNKAFKNSIYMSWGWKSLNFGEEWNWNLSLWIINVIYKHVVARKIWLTRRLVYFVYWINKINKWMKYLAGWGGCLFSNKWLLWSGWTVGWPAIQLLCDLGLAYLCVPDFKHRLHKILLVEKNDWLKNKPFFYNWEFSGDFG